MARKAKENMAAKPYAMPKGVITEQLWPYTPSKP